MALIIGSYFIVNEYYEIGVTLYYAIMLSAVTVIGAFIPLYLWLFTPVPKTYRVKKGNHYSGFRFKPFFKRKKLEADVVFHPSCRYYEEGNDQLNTQINKLFGFGSILHQHNSHRMGWRYDKINDKIILVEYIYKEGERVLKTFETVRINEKTRIVLESDKPYYFGVYRWLFFGGTAKAPHDIAVTINFK